MTARATRNGENWHAGATIAPQPAPVVARTSGATTEAKFKSKQRGGNQGDQHAALCQQVRDYLELRGGWVLKVWGGPMMRAGCPDFLVCLRGLLVGVEVKTGAAVLSRVQQRERDALVAAGAVYVVVRDIEGLETALLEAGLIERRWMVRRKGEG